MALSAGNAASQLPLSTSNTDTLLLARLIDSHGKIKAKLEESAQIDQQAIGDLSQLHDALQAIKQRLGKK